MTAAACATKPAAARPRRLTEPDLDEIEELARANESETYRGALLALVAEVRRLRRIMYRESLYPPEPTKYGSCESR